MSALERTGAFIDLMIDYDERTSVMTLSPSPPLRGIFLPTGVHWWPQASVSLTDVGNSAREAVLVGMVSNSFELLLMVRSDGCVDGFRGKSLQVAFPRVDDIRHYSCHPGFPPKPWNAQEPRCAL
jgi:hypothetical protein